MIVLIIILLPLFIGNLILTFHIYSCVQNKKDIAQKPDIEKDADQYKRKFFLLGKGVYRLLFLKPTTTIRKMGRSVPIRKEFHDKLRMLKKAVGSDKLSLYAYVDNVMENHFETYQEEINSVIMEGESDCDHFTLYDFGETFQDVMSKIEPDGDCDSQTSSRFLKDKDSDSPKTDE